MLIFNYLYLFLIRINNTGNNENIDKKGYFLSREINNNPRNVKNPFTISISKPNLYPKRNCSELILIR